MPLNKQVPIRNTCFQQSSQKKIFFTRGLSQRGWQKLNQHLSKHNHQSSNSVSQASRQNGTVRNLDLRTTGADGLPEGISALEPVATLDEGAGDLLIGGCLATAGAPDPVLPDVLASIVPFKSILCCEAPICEC